MYGMDIVIMGFPKCGTTSLLEYLKIKYKKEIAKEAGFYDYDFEDKISRREWCYLPFEEQLNRFNKVFGDPKDYKIIFITRDPVERIWSGWESWNHHYPTYTFESYLKLDTLRYNYNMGGRGLSYLGEVNPIKQVDYWKWITPWMESYHSEIVKVYSLEGLINDPDFPHINSLKKSPVPDKYRELINSYLN